ncbi:hypothetical protein JXA34_04290 [Patescibacteria group bacterium]|nr:hypothetical protein [Patescibacteria group bacterium]
MGIKQIGQEEVSGILEGYLQKGRERDEKEEKSRMEVIENIVDEMSRRYEGYLGYKTARGKDSPFGREADYSFIEAAAEVAVDNEGLTPVEQRIKRSDFLTLHYAIIGGGLDEMMRKYVEQLSPEEAAELKRDESKMFEVGAEITAGFIVKQREKNKEDVLVERFPDAPTTGFEFEYTDPLRALLEDLEVAPRRVAILEAMRDDDTEKLRGNIYGEDDIKFLLLLEKAAKLAMTGENPSGFRDYIETEIEYRTKELAELRKLMELTQGIGEQKELEEGCRNRLQSGTAVYIERAANRVQELLQNMSGDNEMLVSARANLERQRQLVLGKLEFDEGDTLTSLDVNAMRLLVPSPAWRLSSTAPFQVKDELRSLEEVITQPSLSVRMQLRDFVYAVKLGAFGGEHLNVHQTLAGVELTPKRTDFMEVTAILEAAGLNNPNREIPDYILQEIESGKDGYVKPFKKISKCADGKYYYFPYFGVKNNVAGAVAYPREARTLLELRAMRGFDPETSFSAHVRASTFTWLAAWGEQAANIDEGSRTPEQRQLVEAWETLLSGWKDLLEDKEITQPQGEDRYQEVEVSMDAETGIPKIDYIGDEKYSLYVQQISAKRIREEQQGKSRDPDSFRSRARRLITEYDRKAKEAIGY